MAVRYNVERKATSKVFIILLFFGWLGSTSLSFLQFPEFYQSFSFNGKGHLTWFGSVISGTVALIIYFQFSKTPMKEILNLLAPSVALAYGIGRIGCFSIQDGCFGVPCNPENGNVLCYETERGYYLNTPLLESSISFFIFIVLCLMPYKFRAALFLIAHGSARLGVEFIRVNPALYAGLSFAQIFSVILILAGLIMFFRRD